MFKQQLLYFRLIQRYWHLNLGNNVLFCFSCDKYWYCEEGVAELKTCGNGLGFIDTDPTFTLEQCAELHLVECGERTELEPPISTQNCPRLYGTFADEISCSVFWKCLDGKANRYECPPGLAYDSVDRGCKWADQVPECKNVVIAVEGEAEEFKCPSGGAIGAFTKHAHPADCRQYFVCIGGVPREYGCPLGTVFSLGSDVYSGKCADPEEVEECKNYYGDIKFDNVELSKAGVDTGALPERVRSGSANLVRNSVNRESAPLQNRVAPEEVKRRPAPASLQSIVDEIKEEEEEIEEPARPAFRPRPRPSKPRPSFREPEPSPAQEETFEPVLIPEIQTEVPATSPPRIQVLTDRPRTTFPRRQETTFPVTNRPFTAVFSSEDTLPPLQATTQEPSPVTNSDNLPVSAPASPGPNGEEYYYYYYYDENEAEEPEQ